MQVWVSHPWLVFHVYIYMDIVSQVFRHNISTSLLVFLRLSRKKLVPSAIF